MAVLQRNGNEFSDARARLSSTVEENALLSERLPCGPQC